MEKRRFQVDTMVSVNQDGNAKNSFPLPSPNTEKL